MADLNELTAFAAVARLRSFRQAALERGVCAGKLRLNVSRPAARLLLAPAELPIGIVTALLGAPFFIYLLLRGRS